MKKNLLRIYIKTILASAIIAACGTQNSSTKTTTPTTNPPKVQTTQTVKSPYRLHLPDIKREFRGVWIASVANINWPSKNNLSTEQQKREAIQLLDMLQYNNFNAVILQIRPSGDALYKSSHEPWSYFLTGEIGRTPHPYYDPLEFWIEEAHKRGMELHAWLNPFRVHHSNGGKVTSQSMVYKMPDEVVKLRNGMYWLDPASSKTQDHVSKVVKDILKRYDVDGIHFDDYFYPYASYNGGADFPDSKTWNAYKNKGGSLSKADWRRDNVNRFVERIYKEIKSEKNYVKFGISPFGIWKPGYPAGITGSSQYDELYADAKLWLNKGWIDYFSPQLYWPINSKGQSFPRLLQWWESENTQKRHLWPGLNTIEVKATDRPQEIVNEVLETRKLLKNSIGAIHWSIAGLTKIANMQNMLKTRVYQEKALIPKTPWLKGFELSAPSLNLQHQKESVNIQWHSNSKNVFQWVLIADYSGTWLTEIFPAQQQSQIIPKEVNGKKLRNIAVKAIDRLGNESDYTAEKFNN